MENVQPNDVKAYLEYMYKFMEGDLKQIHGICEEIESRKNNPESRNLNHPSTPLPTHSIQQSSQVQQLNPITPVTTTFETTRSLESYSIPRNFGTEDYRLTIPIAITLFSIADVLGALLREFGLPRVDKGFLDTKKNLNHFFEATYTNDYIQLNVLNKLYRQGLVHNYFPKLGLAVSYHLQKENEHLFYKEGSDVVLNVRRLEKIVIDKLKEIIDIPSIYQTMQGKFNNLNSNYEMNLNQTIEQLRNQL